jgi:hypothetical protein
MKRSVGALGILGLGCAVSLPAANAAVLLKDDFSTDALLKSKATWLQGLGTAIMGDDTILPWYVRDGVLTSSPPDSTSGSDGVAAEDSVLYLLLTGDPKWADVAVQAHYTEEVQSTGVIEMILRAAPKTKVDDPDTWYAFRYTTGSQGVRYTEDADGIASPGSSPNVRIMKVVKGHWTMLAETDNDQQSKVYIPGISASGDDYETGAIFRFVAKGNVLQGFVGLPGKPLEKILEAKDDELKAGLVGFDHYEYNPHFDDLLVEDAP